MPKILTKDSPRSSQFIQILLPKDIKGLTAYLNIRGLTPKKKKETVPVALSI
jgi:hypothetical protein